MLFLTKNRFFFFVWVFIRYIPRDRNVVVVVPTTRLPAKLCAVNDGKRERKRDSEDDDDGFFVVFLLEAANVVASMSFPKRRRKTHDAFSNELVVVVFR